jgi:hypothetical protein
VFWFALGSLAGGATLGVGLGVLAAVVRVVALPDAVAALLVAVIALVCAASDLRVGGFRLPAHTRQVNEDWFVSYRRWVYAAGFGWQLGVGLATFITTAAVYLMIAAAALTANVLGAFLVGIAFAAVRALAFMPARSLTTLDAVGALARRIESWGDASRILTAAAQCMVALAAVAIAGAPELAAAGGVVLAVGSVISLRRTQRGEVARA